MQNDFDISDVVVESFDRMDDLFCVTLVSGVDQDKSVARVDQMRGGFIVADEVEISEDAEGRNIAIHERSLLSEAQNEV